MCGIMGYYAFGRTMPDKKKLEKMFVLLETRGVDASGFAFIDRSREKLKVVKSPVPSSKLVNTKRWKELVPPRIMIFHTRQKTQGEPSNNMNNHPVFNKKGLAIVHNGMIYNDNQIFSKKVNRDAEVDSEAILTVLSNSEKSKDPIKNVFDTLEGGFAVASIDQSRPELLTLFRKDNPIDIAYNSEDDIFYFCSEREIMEEALELKHYMKRGFKLEEKNYHFYSAEDNHAMILNSEGIELYKQYYPKRSFWDYGYDDDIDIVECQYCLGATRHNWGLLINRYEHCGQLLELEDMYV
ncbi:MAG: class II glutamine amidotransferase [Candidatus Kariarchaeaceae archaeon]